MSRILILSSASMLLATMSMADESVYLLNYELSMTRPDGSAIFTAQMEELGLRERASTGHEIDKYAYSLLLSDVEDGRGTLTVFAYEYDSRERPSKIIAETIDDVDFSLGSVAVIDARTNTYDINLTFSIEEAPAEGSVPSFRKSGPAVAEPRQDVGLYDGAIRPVPYFIDGQMRGFRVYPGSNRVKFDALGLKSGDLVLSYDGAALDDVSATLDFIQALDGSAIRFLGVQRGDDRIEIQLD